ncbi:MAG: ARMT1-like domain-containing protein [Planctomycetota bacterium]
MKADPDCIPYALSQVLAAARLVTEDEWIHRKVLLRALADLANETDLERSAPEIIFASITAAYKALGVKDPYENEKARSNKALGALEKELRDRIDGSADPLAAALDLALAGTAVDLGIQDRETAEALLDQAQAEPPAHDERPELLAALARAKTVLYVLNNAGEVVLDKLLIETLLPGRAVTAVVRQAPILNDVTWKDAQAAGLDRLAGVTLLDPGAPMLGLWLESASQELRERFYDADVVLAKGQSNYETLLAAEREVYFLLRPRSMLLAKHLKVSLGDPVVVRHTAADIPSSNSNTGSGKTRAIRRKTK